MRIDVDATGLFPGYHPQKISGEINELYNRGESVRGLVLDVNQNIVLIQSSSGKQFSAKTTIPLDNYLGNEMSFAVIMGENGEYLLVPDLSSKQKSVLNLKIEEILFKFGENANPENKEIISQMIKAGIPVTKENFMQIKEQFNSLKNIQSEKFELPFTNTQIDQPITDLTEELQIFKDYDQSNSNILSEKAASKSIEINELGLKDIIVLKDLDMTVTLKNLNAVYKINEKLVSNPEDVSGIKELINFISEDPKAAEEFSKLKIFSHIDNSDLQNIDSIKLNNLSKEQLVKLLLDTGKIDADNMSFEDLEVLNAMDKPDIIKVLEETFKQNREIKNFGIDSKDSVIEVLTKIKEHMTKLIDNDSNVDNFKTKYEVVSKILEDIASSTENKQIAQKINNDILPRNQILSNFADKYNFSVIPMIVKQNYENILQFYVKREPKKKRFSKKNWLVGISLDTHFHGNIQTNLQLNDSKKLTVTFFVVNNRVKNIINARKNKLLDYLKDIGFSDIVINAQIQEEEEKLIEKVIYKNSKANVFESWV